MRQTNASHPLHLAQPSYNVQPIVSSQQLFQFLCTSWGASGPSTTTHALLPTMQADLQAAKGFVPSAQQESRIGLLMIDASFNTWLRSPSSRLLIVHDEKALGSDASLSTTSYLCALMYELLSAPGMFRLGFFCGLHSSAATAAQPGAQLLQGAVGLMRSLTLQLLLSFGDGSTNFPSPGGNDPNRMLQGLAANDLETMCAVFAMLLWCLPAGAVYVLVDGAFWYGTEARRDDMRTVMLFLDVMVGELQAASRGVALKVLVTNPTPRQRSSWVLGRAVDIRLEQGPLAGGLGGDASRILTGL